jgi:hypothetical protein
VAFVRQWKQGDRVYRALVQSVWNRDLKRPEQVVLRWLGRTEISDTGEADSLSRSFRSAEENFLVETASCRRSLLVYGAWGVGKSFLAQRVTTQLREARVKALYFRWSTPAGVFIKGICEALGVVTERENQSGKPVRVPQAELLEAIGPALVEQQAVLLLDKAQQIPVAIRNWIEVWLEAGATILLFGTLPRKAEIYLKFPRWELRPLEPIQSEQLVRAAAEHYGLTVSRAQRRQLATIGNGNPQFLIRAVQEALLGTEHQMDQSEWIDGTPLVIGALALLLIARYLGQGWSDRNLIVMGGIASVLMRVLALWSRRLSRAESRIE